MVAANVRSQAVSMLGLQEKKKSQVMSEHTEVGDAAASLAVPCQPLPTAPMSTSGALQAHGEALPDQAGCIATFEAALQCDIAAQAAAYSTLQLKRGSAPAGQEARQVQGDATYRRRVHQ